VNREDIARRLETTYEDRWQAGDPWNLDESELAAASHDLQIRLLAGRRYASALEIGCAAGAFTRRLADIADRVVALDIAPSAVARARSKGLDAVRVEFRAANVMEVDLAAEGPWDLVVMSETIYCLGWLYPLFELGWLASSLFAAICPAGRFLMANTYGSEDDHLLRPWLIDTYRDLFVNVGFAVETEQVLRAREGAVELDILVSLFSRPEGAGS
jgi:SAM-dependent methyltransferase